MAHKDETWGIRSVRSTRFPVACVRDEDLSRAIRWQQASVAYRCLYFEVVQVTQKHHTVGIGLWQLLLP
jgi:hypothetical protein